MEVTLYINDAILAAFGVALVFVIVKSIRELI